MYKIHLNPGNKTQQVTGSFASAGGDEHILIASTTISYVAGWPNTYVRQNIFSTLVTYIGCSSGLDVFQMPCRTQSTSRHPPFWDDHANNIRQAVIILEKLK